jgi:glycosyltransferase involved in cell wall biosynthesis
MVNDVAGVARAEVAGLRESGWTVDYYELRTPGARWPRWAKVLVAPLRLALSLPLILRLRRGGYDLVHVHFASQGFIGAFSGRPYFLHAHGSDLHQNMKNPLYRRWTLLWMQGAKRIFYVTPNLEDFLAAFRAKSQLLPNPVAIELFAAIPPPVALSQVLVFMRLAPIKGADTVFAAIDDIRRLVELGVVAWGPLATGYQQAYGDRVMFFEPVPKEQVPSVLRRFDAVIGQMEQGVPGLSELEAMAAGRVVLMRLEARMFPSDAPPVVNVKDGAEIAAAIERLQQAPAEVARLSAAGRAWVRAHHSREAHVAALQEAYRDAAGVG